MESVLPVQETKDRLRTRYNEVKKMRKRSSKEKLTHESIANQCGVSLNAVNAWFSSKREKSLPGLESWIRLSEILDCDLDYLIGLQDVPRKEYAHAAEVTGLSYQACEILADINAGNSETFKEFGGVNASFLDTLSELLEELRYDNISKQPGANFLFYLWIMTGPSRINYSSGRFHDSMFASDMFSITNALEAYISKKLEEYFHE